MQAKLAYTFDEKLIDTHMNKYVSSYNNKAFFSAFSLNKDEQNDPKARTYKT